MITVVYELPFAGVNGGALQEALQAILETQYGIPPEDIKVVHAQNYKIGIEIATYETKSDAPAGAQDDLTTELKSILGVNCRHVETVNGPTPTS